jgi:hypothetical protein
MSDSPNPDISFTENGLVIRDVCKIEEIKTRMECRTDAKCFSWQVGRILRRDFQRVSYKIYKICCNPAGQARTRDLLMELALQAEEMKSKSTEFADMGEPEATTVPIRIVSPQTAMLFQSLKQADETYARLNLAYAQSRLTDRARSEIALGFEDAYSDLKRSLFNFGASNKTASELGKEMGIE